MDRKSLLSSDTWIFDRQSEGVGSVQLTPMLFQDQLYLHAEVVKTQGVNPGREILKQPCKHCDIGEYDPYSC